jgi:hypothetical protein
MNKKEFKKIWEIANSKEDLGDTDLTRFEGCAYPEFKKIHVTSREVAALIRYQALNLNGSFDMEEVDNCIFIAREKFTLLD